jgi:hypothetical protein
MTPSVLRLAVLANARPEDGEQRAGMGEQDALLPVDPERVQVPIVVGRRELAERDFAAARA